MRNCNFCKTVWTFCFTYGLPITAAAGVAVFIALYAMILL